ncbi:MAG: toprim domain-containing protein [Aquisalinus sp.]|nr:toprim domain-containing protein [Aquisalinus sp.]
MAEATQRRIGIADVKPLLQANIRTLCQQLAPGGMFQGNYYLAPNPRRGKDRVGSFVIWTHGAPGAWKEHDAGDAEKGDIIDLLIYTGQARDKKEALDWAKRWCGLGGKSDVEIRRIAGEAKKQQSEQRAKEAKRKEYLVKLSTAIALSGVPLAPEQPAWDWLAHARGIPVQDLRDWQLAHYPEGRAKSFLGALSFVPELQFDWPVSDQLSDEWKHRRPSAGKSKHPGIVVKFAPIGGGNFRGIHRTWLAADGLSKAAVPSPRRMLGPILGCAGFIWHGESGLKPREAEQRGHKSPLVLTEGLEDALSVACAAPELRVWMVGSLSNLMNIPYPPCANSITVFADNDWNNPQAQRALKTAVSRLAVDGPVKVARSHVGKDANDLMMAEANR